MVKQFGADETPPSALTQQSEPRSSPEPCGGTEPSGQRSGRNATVGLSEAEAAALLRSLDPERPIFVDALRALKRGSRDRSLALELAVMGNETLGRFHDQLRAMARGGTRTRADTLMVMLACDVALRAELAVDERDRDTVRLLSSRVRALHLGI